MAHRIAFGVAAFVALALAAVGAREPSAIAGQVRFGADAISVHTSVAPSFEVRRADGSAVSGVAAAYDALDGSYELSGLPAGELLVTAIFHVAGERSTLPGNYRAVARLDVGKLGEAERADFPLAARKVMRVHAPFDNAAELAAPGARDVAALPTIRGGFGRPIWLEWDTVRDDALYELRVREMRDPSHPLGAGHAGDVVLKKSLVGNVFQMPFPRSEAGTHYEFSLLARDLGGREIGEFLVTYRGEPAADRYAFRVD